MRRLRLCPAVLALLAVASVAAAAAPCRADARDDPAGVVAAAFTTRSAPAGATVELLVRGGHRSVVMQIFRVGRERLRPQRDDALEGTPVSAPLCARLRADGSSTVRLGHWPSGFYYARLATRDALGYAPLVIKPEQLGTSRVLVVLPTYTWQAYNRRDDGGDGLGDTWYADAAVTVVDLSRPYLDRGVPPGFRGYSRAFLRWLDRTGKHPDVVADEDLERIPTGDGLARLYDLIVFAGHDEYIGAHALETLARYRDRGGNLAFLSANTFYYAVERHGDRLHGREHWAELGRPPAALTGSDYLGWMKNSYSDQPFTITCARTAPWLLRDTGLRNGDTFGRYGIEVDATSSHSPRSTIVLARITNALGPGRDAEMTYYETPSGARVFSAGALNFGGSLEYEPQATIMQNLWQRLTAPDRL